MTDTPVIYREVVAAAERVLARSLARDVKLGGIVCLSDDDRRNLLLRCRDISSDAPAGFIIKKVVADDYDPEDAASWDTARFFNDWSGAEFLSEALPVPRSARFYGGNRELGLFVLEDLGEHRSLVEPLLDEDAATAETALLAFSTCLASVHAGTIGKSSRFEELLHGLHPRVDARAQALTGLGERVIDLSSCLEGLGVRVPARFSAEVAAVIAAVEDPGPFLSYVHGDPCPDNVSWNGDQVRIIDFEFGGLGHALTDAVYGRMVFPSCWCANRLPDDLVTTMEAAYREELLKGCAEAQDDRVFEAALVAACAFWMLNTLSRLPKALAGDSQRGIGTAAGPARGGAPTV